MNKHNQNRLHQACVNNLIKQNHIKGSNVVEFENKISLSQSLSALQQANDLRIRTHQLGLAFLIDSKAKYNASQFTITLPLQLSRWHSGLTEQSTIIEVIVTELRILLKDSGFSCCVKEFTQSYNLHLHFALVTEQSKCIQVIASSTLDKVLEIIERYGVKHACIKRLRAKTLPMLVEQIDAHNQYRFTTSALCPMGKVYFKAPRIYSRAEAEVVRKKFGYIVHVRSEAKLGREIPSYIVSYFNAHINKRIIIEVEDDAFHKSILANLDFVHNCNIFKNTKIFELLSNNCLILEKTDTFGVKYYSLGFNEKAFEKKHAGASQEEKFKFIAIAKRRISNVKSMFNTVCYTDFDFKYLESTHGFHNIKKSLIAINKINDLGYNFEIAMYQLKLIHKFYPKNLNYYYSVYLMTELSSEIKLEDTNALYGSNDFLFTKPSMNFVKKGLEVLLNSKYNVKLINKVKTLIDHLELNIAPEEFVSNVLEYARNLEEQTLQQSIQNHLLGTITAVTRAFKNESEDCYFKLLVTLLKQSQRILISFYKGIVYGTKEKVGKPKQLFIFKGPRFLSMVNDLMNKLTKGFDSDFSLQMLSLEKFAVKGTPKRGSIIYLGGSFEIADRLVVEIKNYIYKYLLTNVFDYLNRIFNLACYNFLNTHKYVVYCDSSKYYKLPNTKNIEAVDNKLQLVELFDFLRQYSLYNIKKIQNISKLRLNELNTFVGEFTRKIKLFKSSKNMCENEFVNNLKYCVACIVRVIDGNVTAKRFELMWGNYMSLPQKRTILRDHRYLSDRRFDYRNHTESITDHHIFDVTAGAGKTENVVKLLKSMSGYQTYVVQDSNEQIRYFAKRFTGKSIVSCESSKTSRCSDDLLNSLGHIRLKFRNVFSFVVSMAKKIFYSIARYLEGDNYADCHFDSLDASIVSDLSAHLKSYDKRINLQQNNEELYETLCPSLTGYLFELNQQFDKIEGIDVSLLMPTFKSFNLILDEAQVYTNQSIVDLIQMLIRLGVINKLYVFGDSKQNDFDADSRNYVDLLKQIPGIKVVRNNVSMRISTASCAAVKQLLNIDTQTTNNNIGKVVVKEVIDNYSHYEEIIDIAQKAYNKLQRTVGIILPTKGDVAKFFSTIFNANNTKAKLKVLLPQLNIPQEKIDYLLEMKSQVRKVESGFSASEFKSAIISTLSESSVFDVLHASQARGKTYSSTVVYLRDSARDSVSDKNAKFIALTRSTGNMYVYHLGKVEWCDSKQQAINDSDNNSNNRSNSNNSKQPIGPKGGFTRFIISNLYKFSQLALNASAVANLDKLLALSTQ